MARVRDILRKVDDLRRQDQPVSAVPARPAVAALDEETPFIEVGGPSGAIDASPSVLAVPVRTVTSKPPEVAKKASPSIPRPPVVTPKPAETASVVFKAFPPKPEALSPPAARFDADLLVLHNPTHELSVQYQRVLAGLQEQLPTARAQVLLFTPSEADVLPGRLILNLAIARARESTDGVVVVDAHFRTHEIAELLGMAAEPGLLDVLSGTLSLKRAVRESGVDHLLVLTSGTTQRQPPAGLLAGQAMTAVLRHLRDRYPLVFVSAPVWDGRPEIVALASACDAVYLVAAKPDDELQEVIRTQGGALRGCITLPSLAATT
jgi:Mrp family chromosome partitioning ATPase